jgi:hypothetical protein
LFAWLDMDHMLESCGKERVLGQFHFMPSETD